MVTQSNHFEIQMEAMDNRQKLVTKINELIQKLDHTFGDEFKVESFLKNSYEMQDNFGSNNLPKDEFSNSTLNINNNFPYYYPLFSPVVKKETIIINERSKDKSDEEKEKEKDYFNKIIGTVLISGVSFGAVWLFSKDGYVTLLRSGVEKDITDIEWLSLRNGDFNKIERAISTCKEWLYNYKRRISYSFFSKVGLIGSGFAIGTSMFLSSPLLIYSAIGTGTISGCYIFWNYLTYDNLEPNREFNKLMNNLYEAGNSIYQDSGQPAPSAPPFESGQMNEPGSYKIH